MTPDNLYNEKERKAYERASEEHKEAFEQELSEMLDKGKRIATSALVIGGGFAISYYLMKRLSGGKKVKKVKKKKHSPSNEYPETVNEVVVEKKPTVLSTVGNVLLTEIAVFLLAIAKEKLVEYIEKQREDEHPKDA
ncbi:hypothetical protein C900_04457 [Fulvivirga imtechensis AK7]|uniref:Uncharacterized protein n=1 Tax=Fulvivirga imtechensis AK7 TaxID=1237149 RepID=L8JR07_9BACT|nr:hypothetical protein [Fulvivirga imtechensis]ELR69934.1 hypothetical protein C900_04457 [Fulvivirga imtechensis AK7]